MRYLFTLLWLVIALIAICLTSCRFEASLSFEKEEPVVEKPVVKSEIDILKELFPDATITPLPPMGLPDFAPSPQEMRKMKEVLPPLPFNSPRDCFGCHKGNET